jgi:CheY-like chemotaxis protein
VLVVDDDPVSLNVAKAVIEDLGYEVQTRDRALGTSLAIQRDRPDVVLIDITMPGVSGDAIVRLSRANPSVKNTIFILYSGDRANDLAQLVQETGAHGAIAKTGDVHALAQQFEALVASHAPKG